MKKIVFALTAALAIAGCSADKASRQWTGEEATKWYDAQGWLSGCDYIPASAINQIEMWSEATWDPSRIDEELGWAQELGFNTMRVFLSSVVYQNDPSGLKTRMDEFLGICDRHGIRPLFVFFDDCWDPESSYGPQRAPKPGVHNSGWVQDPSAARRADTTVLYPQLEAYVKDIVRTFRGDRRVLLWDLYNEPGNSDYLDSSIPLVKNAFRWAREAGNTQPLTVGVWKKDFAALNALSLSVSDVVSFHSYTGKVDVMQQAIDTLKAYGRPVISTEYMARTRGCTFQKMMPLLKKNNVGAINWGFVAGKTNTIFAWRTPLPDVAEPEVWFHDILRQDHTPFDPEEIEVIKACNGK